MKEHISKVNNRIEKMTFDNLHKCRISLMENWGEIGLNFIGFKKTGDNLTVYVSERIDKASKQFKAPFSDLPLWLEPVDVCHVIGELNRDGTFELNKSINNGKAVEDIKNRVMNLFNQLVK